MTQLHIATLYEAIASFPNTLFKIGLKKYACVCLYIGSLLYIDDYIFVIKDILYACNTCVIYNKKHTYVNLFKSISYTYFSY